MDTIGIFLAKDLIGLNPIKHIQLDHKRETYYEDSGQLVISGRIQNMGISIKENGVLIKDGSLTKFHFGNNIQQMTRIDVKQAIEKLSDYTHLPIQKGKVLKYHFARNIFSEYPPKMYFEYLGQCLRYTRLPMMDGLYYKQRSTKNELCLYDKIVELKKNRIVIPDNFKGLNVIRLEDRNATNPAKYLNRASLITSDLYDEKIYKQIFNEWYRKFSSIEFKRDMQIDYSKIKTKEQMKSVGVLYLIDLFGGLEKVLRDLDEAAAKDELTRKQKSDLKHLVLINSKDMIHTRVPELMLELQEKIKKEVDNYS